jgi:SAM-dependent methyltransferase
VAPKDYFGESVARRYDEDEAAMFEPLMIAATVDFLGGLAGPGPALELGIGTGRIALPLAARGVRVQGIDLSPAMVERLRAKPDGSDIKVTIGDFATATATAAGSFALVYLVFNTIMNLTTADQQIGCFENAAAHLAPGGRFVIEVSVPQLQRLPPGETIRAFEVGETHLGFDEYDVVSQRMISHHYTIGGGSVRVAAVPFRYVWPSELDLMARLAGMRLSERWGSFKRDPFTAESASHVSVWEKPAGDQKA